MTLILAATQLALREASVDTGGHAVRDARTTEIRL